MRFIWKRGQSGFFVAIGLIIIASALFSYYIINKLEQIVSNHDLPVVAVDDWI